MIRLKLGRVDTRDGVIFRLTGAWKTSPVENDLLCWADEYWGACAKATRSSMALI